MTTFAEFEESCNAVWVYKLHESYYRLNVEVNRHTEKWLEEPKFHINPNIMKKWGSWSPSDRVMVFSARLLKNFEWEAVEHVMKHEMAHQIVSEIFDMDCYGVSHGAAWERACLIVGAAPNRCESSNFLSGFKGSGESPVVDKVQKLLVKANDDGVTEAEGELFMKKAHELMLRYDIKMRDVMGKDRLWVTRPIGLNFKRWATYMWRLSDLLKEHYDVQSLQTYGPNDTHRLELFGEPDKLDIAEYVGHALLNQASILYERHKKERAEQMRQKRMKDGYGYRISRLSKSAFFEGLISGYSQKLRLDSEDALDRVGIAVAKEQARDAGRIYREGEKAIVPVYDKRLLEEMYGKQYPHRRTLHSVVACGEGRGAGREAGAGLRLSKGVSQGNGLVKLLN